MSDVLLETLEDGLLTITLNRPERRNALNPELCDALADAVTRAASNPSVRGVLVTGSGGTFCVGGDVGGMGQSKAPDVAAPANDDLEGRIAMLRRQVEAARLLHEMPKPTVAAIEGAAAGAGLSIALACDMRVVARSAKLTTAFAKVGLSGDYGGSYFLTQIVGTARARELYMLSPVISGDEADKLGLVTRLVADGTAEEAGRELGRALASGPTLTLAAIKANLNDALVEPLSRVLDSESERHMHASRTADHREAVAAFLQKRPATFQGQ